MANYYRRDSKINYTPGADVDAGEIVLVGATYCVAEQAIASGEPGTVRVDGIVEMPVDAGFVATSVAAGALVGIDVTAQDVVAAAGGDVDMPLAAPKAAGDTTVQVLVNGA